MDAEILVRDLLKLGPLMMKRFHQPFNMCQMPKQQIFFLQLIQNESMPMSYYSEKLMIPKSNITVLADKLIEGGYIERRDDPADRRKVVLALTPKGKEQVKESVCLFRESLAGSLAVLSQEDMEKLGKCIKEIHEIFKKIDEVQQ